MDDNINNFLRKYMSTWRKHKEKSIIFTEEIGFMNFKEPTQLYIFDFEYDAHPFYFLLKTHFSDKEDLLIEKMGKFSLNNKEEMIIFEQKLLNMFQYYLSEKELSENIDLVAKFLSNQFVGKQIKNTKEGFGSTTSLVDDICIAVYFGDWNKLNIEDETKHNINIQKEMEKNFINYMKSRYDRIECLGVYFHPPIWIGEIPTLTFEEKLQNKRLKDYIKIWVENIGDRKIIYSTDGYFAVEIIKTVTGFNISEKMDNSSEEITSILEIMNLLSAIMVLKGFPLISIQQRNISSTCYYVPKTNYLYFSVQSSSDASYHLHNRNEIILNIHFKNKIKIPLKKFIENIKELQILLVQDELLNFKEILLTGLNCYTYYSQFEYSQAFIQGWTVIEQYVGQIYEKSLNLHIINGERKTSIYKKIEKLNIVDQIKSEDYILLTDLRKKRNDLIHDLSFVNQDIAKKCRDYCLKVIKIMYNENVSQFIQSENT